MNTIEIKGRQVLSIIKTPQPEKEYNKDSKMAGQKYNTYSYEGKAFVVNTNDSFNELHRTGKLYSAKLSINEEGQLSLVGAVSTEQEEAMAKFEARMKRLETVANFQPKEAVTEEEILSLLK